MYENYTFIPCIRYHTHEVVEDIPECKTVKEYKCETKTKGYTTEEVGTE